MMPTSLVKSWDNGLLPLSQGRLKQKPGKKTSQRLASRPLLEGRQLKRSLNSLVLKHAIASPKANSRVTPHSTKMSEVLENSHSLHRTRIQIVKRNPSFEPYMLKQLPESSSQEDVARVFRQFRARHSALNGGSPSKVVCLRQKRRSECIGNLKRSLFSKQFMKNLVFRAWKAYFFSTRAE